ncbi:hypothetical protein U27_04597 [Candidatus Vecturithrix granuli]|uniref:Lipoprotein n=1 Tax=Vecturithrix granuli TaxID=1499967 RepID=A0A081BZ75_VECG1|nr:hypothetical protein U27_04597 [Candidatus Vecturithrix granuli]
MSKFTQIQQMVFWGVVFLLLGSCASQQIMAAEPKVRIKPGRIYEECLKMKQGEVLQFSFTSSKLIDFNIHYHQGENVVYPVNKKQVTTLEGELDYDELEDEAEPDTLCVMWKNPHDVYVNLNYEVLVNNKNE